MLRIGLTGGIGSGKTTVANLFQQKSITIVDADIASREVIKPNTTGFAKIKQTFGEKIIDTKGEINRTLLREIIFTNIKAKQQLEAIVHPLIWQYIEQQVQQSQSPYTILAIPLLLESHKEDKVDRILVVDIPEKIQIQRATKRDKTKDIKQIMAHQVSRTERLKKADDIIDNSKDINYLQQQVDILHQKYLALS